MHKLLRGRKKIYWLVFFIIIGFSSVIVAKANKKGVFIWLPNYLKWEISHNKPNPEDGTVHIMLMLADHHEITDKKKEENFLSDLKKLSDKHHDSDGKPLQYTFFYPYDHFFLKQFDPKVLHSISTYSSLNYGEVQLHWHTPRETSESFRQKLKDAINKFSQFGALVAEDNQARFAFVHGNWTLDNSYNTPDGRGRSGVNNELDILREEGCFADFTFPAFGTLAQPQIVNKIYYALDNPEMPKSYDTGDPVKYRAKKKDKKSFMIAQGLIIVRPFVNNQLIYIDRSNIQDSELPSPKRADNWINNGITIENNSQWVFLKLHMHSGLHPSAITGRDMDETLSYIEKNYNDGKNYKLHYVTAREYYNIVKAAEAGMDGNPNDYRNFIIGPYTYN